MVRPEAQGFNKPIAEPKFSSGEDFKKDKINQAFATLFGGGCQDSTPNFMSTPSFNDNKHQIKARQ
jgi:hypothetical protein